MLEPDYIDSEMLGTNHRDSAGIESQPHLVTIEKEHFSFALYGEVEKIALDDGFVIRFASLSGSGFGAPYYLSLLNDLLIALRDEAISSQFSIEKLLGTKVSSEYLRDTLFVEKALREFVQK